MCRNSVTRTSSGRFGASHLSTIDRSVSLALVISASLISTDAQLCCSSKANRSTGDGDTLLITNTCLSPWRPAGGVLDTCGKNPPNAGAASVEFTDRHQCLHETNSSHGYQWVLCPTGQFGLTGRDKDYLFTRNGGSRADLPNSRLSWGAAPSSGAPRHNELLAEEQRYRLLFRVGLDARQPHLSPPARLPDCL
jgi:hypothetical protein